MTIATLPSSRATRIVPFTFCEQETPYSAFAPGAEQQLAWLAVVCLGSAELGEATLSQKHPKGSMDSMEMAQGVHFTSRS